MTAPRARDDIASVILDGEAVIHRAGQVHLLDPVATLVWRCCDGEASRDEIAGELAEVFATPVGMVRRDVAAVIDELATLDLLTDADARLAEVPGPELLADPPGSCASCAEKVWLTRSTFRVGSFLVTVGADDAVVDAALREALAAHLVDPPPTAAAEPPFLGVTTPSAAPARGPQPLYLLHRADAVAARTRRPDHLMRAVIGHLATYGDLGALGLATVGGLVVGRGEVAVIVPEPADAGRFRHELSRYGVQVADLPVAIVDPETREAVVGAPGLQVALDAVAALADRASSASGAGLEPLPWGRYRIAAMGVTEVATPSTALLAFGPVRGDHRDHAATFAALVTLLDTVPIVGSVEPELISRFLGAA